LLWCWLVLFTIGAAALLAAGLYKTIPCTKEIITCTRVNTIGDNGVCWQQYWTCQNNGLFFILSCAGVASLLAALLCLCIMCCVRRPKSKFEDQQYYTGSPAADTAPVTAGPTTTYGINDTGATGATATYPDQYAAYNPNYGGKTSSSYA